MNNLRTGLPGSRRRGALLVKVALLMPVMIGMLGLVLDVGLLMTTHRQARNAADAAALAAAMDMVRGRSASAMATAQTFIRERNGLAAAEALAAGTSYNCPPSAGAYAGKENFVEVIVTVPVQTLFIQVLGVNRNRTIQARAVAGFRAVSAGEGVMVLDENAAPGLKVSGNGYIWVNGRVTVNAAHPTNAATADGGGRIYGTEISIVGGISSPENFLDIATGEPIAVLTGQLPEPDPLINLATPATGNGVDPTLRGSVKVSNTKATFGGNAGGLNHTATAGEVVANGVYTANAGDAIIYPGIYNEFDVSDGTVLMVPGIYVLRPEGQSDNFKITGGNVIGKGVMLYCTGSDYNPTDGTPDVHDREQLPPASSRYLGSISLTANAQLSPIDTTLYNYSAMYTGAKGVSDAFDGMLFFQRRRNNKGVSITGNASAGGLTGTLYAKWTQFSVSGQGTYDAQFICGSLATTGQGAITVRAGGSERGRANRVYLVE